MADRAHRGGGQLSALHRGAAHAAHNIAPRQAWRFGPRVRVTTGWADGYYACEVTLPLA